MNKQFYFLDPSGRQRNSTVYPLLYPVVPAGLRNCAAACLSLQLLLVNWPRALYEVEACRPIWVQPGAQAKGPAGATALKQHLSAQVCGTDAISTSVTVSSSMLATQERRRVHAPMQPTFGEHIQLYQQRA
jgi:hypothetical protein